MRTVFALALLAACSGDPDRQPGNPPGGGDVDDVVNPPGYRPLSRLNATEYDATVRDLLGTEVQPGRNFPPDEIAYGFDNVAEALTTTSTHVELWENATDVLLDEMFGRNLETTMDYGVQAEAAGVTYLGEGEAFSDYAYALYDGSLSSPFSLDYDGTFDVKIGAFGHMDGALMPEMVLRIDGADVQTWPVPNGVGDVNEFVAQVQLGTGLHTFEVAIANPVEGSTLAVVVDYLRVTGPTDPETGRTEAYTRFVGCAPDGQPSRDCARDSIEAFGRMAWRRPLTGADVDWALGLYDQGLDADLDEGESLQLAFKAVLLAPEFLFRPERDPDGEATWVALDGFEVATRMAEFAWSSTPDEQLLVAAERGDLATRDGVKAQLVRMLADSRADALVDNLAGQWFSVRRLDGLALDTTLYPEFDDELRASMQEELRRVLRGFFREGERLDDVLTAQETWVDGRLADLYRMPVDPGDGWVQTDTVGLDRYGVFGTAGWLAATSRSNGPSAVKRGKWVLDNLLCSPPPPPPPNVESNLVIVPDEGSVRQQEELMRSDEFCQTCHSQMDPLGFALGGFDAIGRERALDELGYAVDDQTVWNGVALDGPESLTDLVVSDERLARCAVEKTFTYAIGRGVSLEDGPTIESITADFVSNGMTFDALAEAIVASDTFRLRGVAPEVK